MSKDEKETINFILHTIETISLAILTEDYDMQEIEEIHQNASIHMIE